MRVVHCIKNTSQVPWGIVVKESLKKKKKVSDYEVLKTDLYFIFSMTCTDLLTAEITCCGKSLGVE